jgi:hypothetical protein
MGEKFVGGFTLGRVPFGPHRLFAAFGDQNLIA